METFRWQQAVIPVKWYQTGTDHPVYLKVTQCVSVVVFLGLSEGLLLSQTFDGFWHTTQHFQKLGN